MQRGKRNDPGRIDCRDDSSKVDLHSALASASPQLLEYGGARRVIAVLPRSRDRGAFAEKLGIPVTAISSSDNSLTLCVEASDLALDHIALQFVERRRDRVEFAKRVHSRTDIEWAPLVPTVARTEPSVSLPVDRRSTDAREEASKTLVM